MNTKEKDAKYLGRDNPPTPIEVVKSDGSYLYDETGKKYIDFYYGWCVGNIGWNVEEVVKKVRDFAGPNYINPAYLYKGWAELAELLAEITPEGLTKSFRATGGTEAVEIALQLAMAHTKRHKFVSIENSYHGHSIGAMSVGGSFFRDWYSNLLPDCYKVNAPLNAAAAKKIEEFLSAGDIAAVIMEPIVCNLGVVVPDQEFFDIVQAVCKKNGTLLIIDEVATGFGRTGKMFGLEHYGLKPDIVTMGKGITGGFGGLGATITTAEIAKSFEFDFSFYSTFGWHPLNTEAAISNIRYIRDNQKTLFSNAAKLSEYFESRLKEMKFKHTPEIRVKGLAICLEFPTENADYAESLRSKAMEKGLLLTGVNPHHVVMYPSLNMSIDVAKEGLDILEQVV